MSNITLEEYLNRLEQFRRRESNNQVLPSSIIIDDAGPDQSSNHCPVYNPARLLPRWILQVINSGRYTTYTWKASAEDDFSSTDESEDDNKSMDSGQVIQ